MFSPDTTESLQTVPNTRLPDTFVDPCVALRRAGDTIYLTCPLPLPVGAHRVGDWLEDWAARSPDAICIAEREGDDWNRVSWSEMLHRVKRIATYLLSTGAGPQKPVAILAENSANHLAVSLAAMHIGAPSSAISIGRVYGSGDKSQLRGMIALLDPAVIYVAHMDKADAALTAIANDHSASILTPGPSTRGAICLPDLPPTDEDAVNRAFQATGPDTVAKLMFTSGSTGVPKAVITTHRMLTSNQESNAVFSTHLKQRRPVILDWLPWSHTFAGSYTTGLVLRNGGTYYIDDGRPVPGLIHRTLSNLKEVRPTALFNVPRGYDMLLQAMQDDPELRDVILNADIIKYAAAALPRAVWDRLLSLSLEETGAITPIVASWGATETAPMATSCWFQADEPGNIGLPVPGTELKLIPVGDKLEVRVKGPNVTPGYWRNAEQTDAAFDEEGFLIMGDAVRFADPDRPEAGLFFDGRISENFKLTSGTWVNVGDIRMAGIDALAPLATDIVVAGHDRDYVGFLVFPNEAACRTLSGLADGTPLPVVLASTPVREAIASGLARLKNSGGGSSRYAARARLLETPPQAAAGEITDKAYINQRQVLTLRAQELDHLFGDEQDQFISPAQG
ncbi:MAG: feruloyl-CoA synthase [Pelagimonas sp.]|uniref:feruloyl-CoA synthase n=1 Tax=Pelagimonas sp. TaxID=2073170 RepID=UPI003D6B2C76